MYLKREQRKSCVSAWHRTLRSGTQEAACWITSAIESWSSRFGRRILEYRMPWHSDKFLGMSRQVGCAVRAPPRPQSGKKVSPPPLPTPMILPIDDDPLAQQLLTNTMRLTQQSNPRWSPAIIEARWYIYKFHCRSLTVLNNFKSLLHGYCRNGENSVETGWHQTGKRNTSRKILLHRQFLVYVVRNLIWSQGLETIFSTNKLETH
jgi:hypothetical protein